MKLAAFELEVPIFAPFAQSHDGADPTAPTPMRLVTVTVHADLHAQTLILSAEDRESREVFGTTISRARLRISGAENMDESHVLLQLSEDDLRALCSRIILPPSDTIRDDASYGGTSRRRARFAAWHKAAAPYVVLAGV